MKEGLIVGAGIIAAGVFVGFVACKLITNPKAIKSAKDKASNVAKKSSEVAAEAKKAFTEGFKGATAKVATT